MARKNPRKTQSRSTLGLRRPLRFQLRYGIVKDAHIEGAETICGIGEEDRIRTITIDENIHLLADFANWGNEPKEILDFTKKHGPLDPAFKKAGQFRFTIRRWLELQRQFRELWEKRVPGKGRPLPNALGESKDVNRGESFDFDFNGESWYGVSTLYRFLEFGLLTCVRWMLRECENPECTSKYFVAKRSDQKYCSPDCANWAQKKSKLKYWHKRAEHQRHS